MRLAAVLLALATSSALAQGTPPTPAKAAEPPGPGHGEHSTLTVRCMDECSVRVDGKAGRRKDPATWEFMDVAPGQHRIEATGGFLNRPLYNGYAEIPGGMKVTAQIDSKKRLTITERTPLTEVKKAQAEGGAASVLTIRCPKNCTVSVDGTRKGAGQAKLVVVRDVPPGEHNVEVKFVLGTKVVRSVLNIPAGSEVFATATESGLSITNSKPLSP